MKPSIITCLHSTILSISLLVYLIGSCTFVLAAEIHRSQPMFSQSFSRLPGRVGTNYLQLYDDLVGKILVENKTGMDEFNELNKL